MGQLKKCSRCGKRLARSGFHKNSTCKDGLAYWCKACCKAQQDKRYLDNPEKVLSEKRKSINKRRREDPRGWAKKVRESYDPVVGKAAQARWAKANPGEREASWARSRARHPVEVSAGKALRTAVRSGIVVKPSCCEKCEETFDAPKLHGHHDDYLKPLTVRWLCHACHMQHHVEMRDQECRH